MDKEVLEEHLEELRKNTEKASFLLNKWFCSTRSVANRRRLFEIWQQVECANVGLKDLLKEVENEEVCSKKE